jgi:hypothetical protein
MTSSSEDEQDVLIVLPKPKPPAREPPRRMVAEGVVPNLVGADAPCWANSDAPRCCRERRRLVAGVGLLRACSVRGVSVSSTDPVVRLVREPLLGGCDPVAAARWLRGEPRAVALSGAWCGGGTLLSSHPLDVAAQDDDPFEVLGTSPLGFSPAAGCVELHVGGGWFGWLGFGLAAAVEALPPAPPRAQDLPLFDLAFHDHVVRCDPQGEWWFEALWTGERAAFLSERLEFWRERVALAPPPALRSALRRLGQPVLG